MKRPLVKTACVVGVLLLAPAGVAVLIDEDQPTASGATASDKVPEQYRELVNSAGATCEGITPGIIGAQIQQESGWNPTATSGAGAQGISQFMPATWATAGKDHNGDGKADPLDPADAIPSQARYLCDQLAAVDAAIADGRLPAGSDRVELALAAYNAGLGAVLSAGGIPPYAETQNYVRVIKDNAPNFENAAPAGSGAASGDITQALEWAKQVAADDSHQYVWGAEGPDNYDCSGYSKAIMARVGIDLPRTANDQGHDERGTTVASIDQARPGDLLFWGNGHYHHVAVYAGDGMMVSADTEATGINYEKVYDGVTLIKRFK